MSSYLIVMKAGNNVFLQSPMQTFWNVTGKRGVTCQKPAAEETVKIRGYQPSKQNKLEIVSDFT